MCRFSEAFLNIRAENILILVKTKLEAAARLRSLTNWGANVIGILTSWAHRGCRNLVELFTVIQPQTSRASEVFLFFYFFRDIKLTTMPLASLLSLTVIKIMHFQEKKSSIIHKDRESKQKEKQISCLRPQISSKGLKAKILIYFDIIILLF